MVMLALLLVIPGAIVGLGLLAVGIWWRSGSKALRIVLIVVGALIALLDVGLVGSLIVARTTG
jgi:hypothetical protein